MKARASFAAGGARRWSAMRSTGSRRACFCSWVGKCMRGVGKRAGKTVIVLQTALRVSYGPEAAGLPREAVPADRSPIIQGGFKMHRTLKIAVAAVACALLAVPVYAQTLEKIKQAGSITVGHRD